MPTPLPPAFKDLFESHPDAESLFRALLPLVCHELESDRCFLDVRHPATRMYRNFCWCRRPDIPDLSMAGWELEQPWETEDPMFAAALQTAPSIFVNDVETADSEVLNREFERSNFGHRALIHAHICHNGQLWGILQPCMFGHPRVWSDRDQYIIHALTQHLAPIVVRYVQQMSPDTGTK